jgi:hypothetical protein
VSAAAVSRFLLFMFSPVVEWLIRFFDWPGKPFVWSVKSMVYL